MKKQTFVQKIAGSFLALVFLCMAGFASAPAVVSAMPLPTQSVAAVTCKQVTSGSDAVPPTGTGMQCIFQTYVNPFVKFMAGLVGVAVIISIVWGAILYQTSAGDSGKVAAAKNKIYQAVVALIIFLFLIAALEWLLPGGLNAGNNIPS